MNIIYIRLFFLKASFELIILVALFLSLLVTTFFLQMQLDIRFNQQIDDNGAAILLNCLNKIKKLWLRECNISAEMLSAIEDRGSKEGCILKRN